MEDRKSGTFFVKGEKIVLKRDSTWLADGIEITHEPTRALFYRAISWDAEARSYCLKVGYETIHIEVEDTPFFVVALEGTIAKLTDHRGITIVAKNLSYSSGSLYLALDDGQRAKFLSAPYYDLLKNLEEDATGYFVLIAGERADLSRVRPSGKGL